MSTKICFKCNKEKPLSDYYKHPRMGDGHLNKCKSCTKSDTKANTLEKSKDSLWVEKEKKRGREKYYRLGYKETHKPSSEYKKLIMDRYKEKYPEKLLAKNAICRMVSLKGHLHHWSYNKEFFKDVIDISIKDHYTIHRFIIYDQERLMYRRIDTMELLDTKEKHENYISDVLKY